MFTFNGTEAAGRLELAHLNISPKTGLRIPTGQRESRISHVGFADGYLEIMRESKYGHPLGAERVDAIDVNKSRICRRLGIQYVP